MIPCMFVFRINLQMMSSNNWAPLPTGKQSIPNLFKRRLIWPGKKAERYWYRQGFIYAAR